MAGRLRRGGELRLTVAPGRHDVAARIDWSGSPTAQVDVPAGGTATVTVLPGSMLTGLVRRDQWLALTVD